MNTITSYKVVFVDSYGDLKEVDYTDETAARTFARQTANSILYKVQILGNIERLTI